LTFYAEEGFTYELWHQKWVPRKSRYIAYYSVAPMLSRVT